MREYEITYRNAEGNYGRDYIMAHSLAEARACAFDWADGNTYPVTIIRVELS